MNGIFHKAPYLRFMEFVAPGADRFALLRSVLEENGLSCSVLSLEDKRHLVVSQSGALPDSSCASIFTAHYDRTAGSPGANDNGAAVFQLVETAMHLYAHTDARLGGGYPPLLFIFTDGEELSSGEDLRHQGSYHLGLYLKHCGLEHARVFTFDACGRGDTLVISTAADELLKNETAPGAEAARRRVQSLRDAALEAARTARLEKVMLLPTPFSEDAGFLLAGMTAQTISALPHNEAAAFASLARRGGPLPTFGGKQRDYRQIPETWRSLNGPGDSPLRLTTEYWKHITAFAKALADFQCSAE